MEEKKILGRYQSAEELVDPSPSWNVPENSEVTYPKPKQEFDEEIFSGGPMQSELNSWKKQFVEVYLTELGLEAFIWRPLNRYEYKKITSVPNTDPLMREEMICEQCVLWPYNYTFDEMANGKAGVPALLAESIMEVSGFSRMSLPQLL